MNRRRARWPYTKSAKFAEFREQQIPEMLDLQYPGADFPNRRYQPITQMELDGSLHSSRVAEAKDAQP